MRFKVVSTGYRCGDLWRQTLESLETQDDTDWDACVIYDGGDDSGPEIAAWCAERDERWRCILNEQRMRAVRNQVAAVQELDPDPEDVIVWLDLDGDQLAGTDVLSYIRGVYSAPNAPWITFGSYKPMEIPAGVRSPPASPIPARVVRSRGYRAETLSRRGCHWNHLRTMKAKVLLAIPPEHFRWPDGRWYEAGCDYIMMTAALELANGKHKFIKRTTLLYHHGPLKPADPDTDACVRDYLSRPPLEPL